MAPGWVIGYGGCISMKNLLIFPRILVYFGVVSVVFGVGLRLAPVSSAADQGGDLPLPPNVVVVFIDDMGWADLSCFGEGEGRTPQIDRLAVEGIRFHQFYVNSPICSPSRTAITTGQYPQRWSITSYLDNRAANRRRGVADWLDPEAPVLARMLRRAGYATGHFGKWHMGGQRDVGDAPLITEYGFDESLTNFEGLGPRVLAWLNAYDGSEPRRHALGSDRLGRGEITWVNRDLVTTRFVEEAVDFIDGSVESGKPFYINLWPDDVHTPLFPPADLRGDGSKRDRYIGVLKAMDRQLGVLFDRIRSSEKLRMNTIILLCSDNGPEPGAGVAEPLRGFKTHLYEGGIRSPLIVWAPGLMNPDRAGTINDRSVLCAMDLVPSILSLCHAEKSPGTIFDGEDLSDVLIGLSTRSRVNPIFFRRPPDRDSFYGVSDLPDLAVRDGRWKLLCEYGGQNPELYDLLTDPEESEECSISHPEVVTRLIRSVVGWHLSMPQDRGAELAVDR